MNWPSLKKKKKMEQDRFEERLLSVRNLHDAWKFINKERESKRRIRTLPPEEELVSHFKRTLEGSATISRRCIKKSPLQTPISEDEVDKAIRQLKLKKSCGPDDIPSEAYKLAGDKFKTALMEIINEIGAGHNLPDEWRRSRLVPIYKKGARQEAANYRGICISDVIYKIWTQILLNRLNRILDERGLIPDNQAGFRKERSTMDNVYVLTSLANLKQQQGKTLDALFIVLERRI